MTDTSSSGAYRIFWSKQILDQRPPSRNPGFSSIWVRLAASSADLLTKSRFGAVYMICAVGVYV